MIVHGHVLIDKRRTDAPSYMVPVEEEARIEVLKEMKGEK
jgi:ribosomal protein S4